ncbi:MAG: hypothetical protein VB032_07910 [Burkholderiaceae bacterium]|nr:hypothetical protein [Burkholderiaceae bacterium]
MTTILLGKIDTGNGDAMPGCAYATDRTAGPDFIWPAAVFPSPFHQSYRHSACLPASAGQSHPPYPCHTVRGELQA